MQKEYVRMAFTEEEKDLLFDACLCYADDLTEARKKLRNTEDANEIVEAKIKRLYQLGKEIVEAFAREGGNGCWKSGEVSDGCGKNGMVKSWNGCVQMCREGRQKRLRS